jgi:putative MATE family efflux protein
MKPAAPPKLSLLAIAWPIFVEQGLRMLIGTVDVFMVSHVSDHAVAGLSVANQILVFFIIAFNFIGIGSSIVITHYLGAGDRAGADRLTTSAIALNTWLGLGASVAVFFCAASLLRLMHLPAELLPYALPFLSMMGGSLFMESMNMSVAAVLRAHGHTRDAMFVTVGQNILNVCGNCILLFGLLGAPQMGVVGVALSGVFSRCCASIAFFVLLDYRTHLRLRALDFIRIDWSKVGRVLRIGLPAAGENMTYWLAFMLMTTFIARLGGDSLAIQSYTFQVQWFVILFSVSIGLGTEIMIGHLVGAGKFEEAYRELLKSLRIGFLFAIGGIFVLALFAPLILGVFTPNPVIIAGGTVLLRIAMITEPGRVFNIIVINSLRATGDVGFPISMAVFSMWGVWIPLAWLLGIKLGWGLPGIWLAMATDEWLRGILMYRRWKSRAWLKHARRSRAQVANDPLTVAPKS